MEPGVKVAAPEYGFVDPRGADGKRNVFIFFGITLLALLVTWWKSETTDSGLHSKHDEMSRSHKSVEEDTYGFAIVSLIRDLQQISTGECSSSNVKLRSTRIFFAMALLAFTTFLQMLIMWYVKTLVIAAWVTNIRDDYSAYELHMYGEGNTELNINGKHRGIPGNFQPGNFDSLDGGLKERVCNIAFSQTWFFGSVLLIWTLTVILELRGILALFRSLIINTKNITDMKDALQDLDEDKDDDDPENRWVVDGLTMRVKALCLFCVIIPRFILTFILLWLGCRFLAATNDFGEMVLNAIALEFVLMLKDLLYYTIVPDRNKREIAHINIRPSSKTDHPTYWSYLGTFSWLFVAFAWIVFYVFHFQMVLPFYKWDVRGPCMNYIKVRYYDGPVTAAPSFF